MESDGGRGRLEPDYPPADIAAAIVEILDRPVGEREVWRRRIQVAARERYSWPVAAAAYRRLIDGLRPGAMGQ